MNKNPKQSAFNISIAASKTVLFALLAFNALVFVYFGLIRRGDIIQRESIRYVENWNVETDENGDQIVTNTLPADVKSNEYLFFDTRNDVSVYINGELRKDFVESRDVNTPGGSFTRFVMFVPLSESDSGAEITVLRVSPQDIDKRTPEFFISTRAGAISHLLKTSGLAFILSFIVIAFSFVTYIVSIVLRHFYKHKIDMTYGALGILSISAWLFTDSYLFPYLFGVYHVNGLLSYMFCLVMPLPLGIYLSSIQRGRYKWTTAAVMTLAILNAVGFPFLHFTGIVHFHYLRNTANVVLVILALCGIVILLVDAVRGKIGEYRYTFIGFLGFLFSGLLELVATLMYLPFVRAYIPIVTGLAFFLTFIVIQQIHDLRMLNAEKQHAIDISEAKTKFLASMSHEIRTPINSILGMNEMILRENNDSVIDEYSRNIKTSGKMLLMLVNDVLDFTKIESGKMEIKEEDFRLDDLLCDVISLIKERAEEKSLVLNTQIAEKVPNDMIGDEFRIRQILVNLLNNAVKYTENGSITLYVGGEFKEDGYILHLRVKDTGKGIRKEDIGQLFDAFSRADMKTNANIEGTGLGLAIVKSIVSSMNGEVGVESEYGAGSEFYVHLPVKYTGPELLADDFMVGRNLQDTVSENCSFTAPDASILAVDDNQSNLTIVKLFLKRNGIVPDLCTSGNRAIELCKEKKYDLILLDHMMPQPDGIETLHAIKSDKDSQNRDTKVIVLTANAVAGSKQMYLSEGFDDYLTKPLDSEVLEEAVKRMLPKNKVLETETETAEVSQSGTDVSLRSRLSAIKGLDYDTAFTFCGDDEDILTEIITEIVKESANRAERMKADLEARDLASYKIETHSVKSSMATIGLKDFSERAKRHEFAARDNDIAFIYGDSEAFINEYTSLCESLAGAVRYE